MDYEIQYSMTIDYVDRVLEANKDILEAVSYTHLDVYKRQSELNGEYLGWHSHNLRLVNCHITGEPPLCYAHDLVLETMCIRDRLLQCLIITGNLTIRS